MAGAEGPAIRGIRADNIGDTAEGANSAGNDSR